MGVVDRIGPPAPPPAVMAILNRFNRDQLGNAIEVLVALLDVWDGDPDAEVELVEDDFFERPIGIDFGPGCDISDAPEDDDDDTAVDDQGCDPDEGV